MCQPLGTLESCCQSLWLLSHGSGGDTLGRVRLPQMSQRLPGRMGGQRGGGGGIWGFCSQCWGWSTAALAPTLHLWLAFLSPKMWRMLIRILTQLQGAYASSDFRSWVTKQKQTDAMIPFFTVWSILVLNEQPFFAVLNLMDFTMRTKFPLLVGNEFLFLSLLILSFTWARWGRLVHSNGKSSLTTSLPERL